MMSSLMLKQAEDAKTISKVNVEAVAVESATDNSAVVLVVAKSDVTDADNNKRPPQLWRLSVRDRPRRRSVKDVESRLPAMNVEQGPSVDTVGSPDDGTETSAPMRRTHPSLTEIGRATARGAIGRWTRRYLAKWRSILATALVVATVGGAAGVVLHSVPSGSAA